MKMHGYVILVVGICELGKMHGYVILVVGDMRTGENARLRDPGGGGYVNWGKCTAT